MNMKPTVCKIMTLASNFSHLKLGQTVPKVTVTIKLRTQTNILLVILAIARAKAFIYLVTVTVTPATLNKKIPNIANIVRINNVGFYANSSKYTANP